MRGERIPTQQEINVFNSPDEQIACDNFLGKSLDEAQRLFVENSIYYQEGLMWMGPAAFRFYVKAAIRYIKSPEAKEDSGMISCLASILEFRLEYESKDELAPVAAELASACRFILAHWSFFDVIPEVYVGLKDRYLALEKSLSSIKRRKP